MLIILISLTLIGVVTIVLVNYLTSENEQTEPTIDEIVALSFDTEEMTTMLKTNEFARIRLRIQVDNRKALQEIQKRDFQVKNIINKVISDLTARDLMGSEGIENLQELIKLEINKEMQEGMIVQVYVTHRIIQ